jgi:hypothetical protein
MDAKPKFSPNGTYVLDAEDIEQLDELSLTSIVTALVEAAPDDDPKLQAPSIAAPSVAGDTTINQILSAPPAAADQPLKPPNFPAEPEPTITAGDLLAPELMFPDLAPQKKGRNG